MNQQFVQVNTKKDINIKQVTPFRLCKSIKQFLVSTKIRLLVSRGSGSSILDEKFPVTFLLASSFMITHRLS
jgi:hypothetical protein